MTDNREVYYEQALIAVLGAAKEMGIDMEELERKAVRYIEGNGKYRMIDDPENAYATASVKKKLREIKEAWNI